MSTLQSELSPAELKALKDAMGSLGEYRHVAEVGTAAGGTLVEMLRALESVNQLNTTQVSVVDTFNYFQDHQQIWQRNLTENGFSPDRICLYPFRTSTAYEKMRDEGVNLSFVLVDAGHKLKDVIQDVRFLSLLDMGGMGAFHDYSGRFPGVVLAVDRFLQRNPEFVRVGLYESLLLVRKQGETKRNVMPCWIIGWMTLRSLLMQWGKSIRKRMPGDRNSD